MSTAQKTAWKSCAGSLMAEMKQKLNAWTKQQYWILPA